MGSLLVLEPETEFEEGRLLPRGVATLRLSTQHAGLRSPARERSGGAHKRGGRRDGPNTIPPVGFVRVGRGRLSAGPVLRNLGRVASSVGGRLPTGPRFCANPLP